MHPIKICARLAAVVAAVMRGPGWDPGLPTQRPPHGGARSMALLLAVLIGAFTVGLWVGQGPDGPAEAAAPNTWTAAASMATARRVHTATLLASGKVLIAGGLGAAGALAGAELYDPGTNISSAAASMASALQPCSDVAA